MPRPKRSSWTIEDLREDLREFEEELMEANLKPSSVETYVGQRHLHPMAGRRV